MAIELKMPALSPTMEKGTLARWLVAEGDVVRPGDLIAEIETDKATMEMEAQDEGRISKLVVAEGTDGVVVGETIALLTETGEAIAENPVAVAETVPVTAPITAPPSLPAPVAVPPVAMPAAAPEPDVVAPIRRSPADRIRVSPLAQRIADARRIDLSGITGSGPNGRIVRADLGLPSTASRGVPSVAPVPPTALAPTAVFPPPDGVPRETIRLSSMRKTIARRLSESKQTVPHFYLTARCNLDPLLRLRATLNESIAASGVKLSVNDLLMKAMSIAFVQVPDANVQFGGDELHRFQRVDIAMAVAIDGGLITPVIQNVAALSLTAIADRTKQAAEKARAGKLAPEEYQGGTASISNLGMFGIDEMFPVLNPPQAVILGIGAGIRQPWDVAGELALATVFAATGSFDHRAIDGAVAARFMAAFKAAVENPLQLVA